MPKKRANARAASTPSSSGSASSPASSTTNPPNRGNNTSGGNSGVFANMGQLTPAMMRELMEATSKTARERDFNNFMSNISADDLDKLLSNTAANNVAAAVAASANNSKGPKNNNASSRGKVTGVKIVRQSSAPFVGPPLPPGHASSQKPSSQNPMAMGVSATFSKADGSTATVDLDAAAIAAMMSQANSNNPEAFNAGLKQILAAAAAAQQQQSSSSSGMSQQQQKQNAESLKQKAALANKIASSIAASYGEDDNNSKSSSSTNKTSSKKKSGSINSSNTNNSQQQQQTSAQIQSLFSSLFNVAQQMDSSSSFPSSSQEAMQNNNDFASFRKAAFVAGVNVAIQQEAEREAQHEMEKMIQQHKNDIQQALQLKEALLQSQMNSAKKLKQQQQQQQQKSKSVKKSASSGSSSGSSATASAKSNVFSMIFGGGGGSSASSSTTTAAPTASTTSNTSSSSVVPIIPPPPGGFPQDSLVAQAASVLADYGTNDEDEKLNLAVSLGSQLLKSVNMSLDTEDDARRAYERVTSCLTAEERNIVESFATNFADLPDDVVGERGLGCLPDDLLHVMSKSMASVMNLANPGLIERLAQEMDRVKKSAGVAAMPPPQDRPSFEHLPDDDDDDSTQQHKNEEELAASERAKEEEEERKRQKRRDKKARKRKRLKKEAELKAAAAAIKKRERTITSWRSRVIAACTSGDARKMESLIGESPYKNYTFEPVVKEEDDGDDDDDDEEEQVTNDDDDGPKNHEEYLLQQLNWFIPNCLQKYQTRRGASFDALPFEFNVARELLAKYIISTSFDVFLQPVPSFSRTSIHSAAYANDVDFIKWVLHGLKDEEKDFLEKPCTDAGWTPLHYATAGGAKSALELLMAEKCNVKARTQPSLTCFRTFTPFQSSNGITARELAVVLQAGAVDDDLTSKAEILVEIVDKRIVNASDSDKTAYMRSLKAIEERLKEVEKNGYRPLPEKEEQIEIVFEETPSESTTSATKKKSKKKNKKKAKEPTPSPAPAAAVSPMEPEVPKGKSAPGDDLSDPVAVALLGMGFSEDQIKAAAKAFGGFVGADDMVMWILSGGDTSTMDQTNSNSQQPSPTPKESVSSTSNTKSFTTKAQQKALTRAQKKAEEAARKRQDDIANAQKAAAKREEQRRLRREWNEREQARQQEEKNAKLAKALERQRRAEMEKVMADMPKGPPGPGIPMSINIGGGGGGGKGGPPMTIVAGGSKKAPKKSNMGIPQAPTVKAPQILARPSDAPKGSSAGNQPLFAKPAAPSKSSSRASKPSNPSTHQPTMILKKGAKPPATNKGISASAPEFRPPSQVSDGSISSSGSAGKQQSYPVQKGAKKSSVPPPGFQPAVPGKAVDQSATMAAAPSSFVEPNHMGMIRATAREFVPSFAPSPSVSENNVVPSMSAQSSSDSKHPSAPQSSTSFTENNASKKNGPDAASSLIEPMSSLLSNVTSSSPTPSTLAQVGVVDPTVSAASSITGLSGTLSEEKPTSRIGSIMTFESNTTSGGLQGSSILESISYGAPPSADQGTTLGNIWGGGGGTTSTTTTNQHDALGGLGGFDFSSFMQNDALSDPNNGNGVGTNGNTTTTSSALGGNALGNNTWGGNGAIGGDSIW